MKPTEQIKEIQELLVKVQLAMKDYLRNTESFDHYYMDLAREHTRKVSQLITKEIIKNGVKNEIRQKN